MNLLLKIFAALVLTACMHLHAAGTFEVWNGVDMPGQATDKPEEGKNSPEDLCCFHVSKPTLEFFKADTKAPAGAVIICPGGGYGMLAYGKEGASVAKFLSGQGINCFVLKYRVPSNRDGAFQDAQRAVRLVRKNASKFNVDPKKIGIMGFSAGGHLAARTSTNPDAESYKPFDAADRVSARPDFTVLIYPAYIADNATYELKPEIRVDEKTPPAFIVQTQDDTSYVGSSVGYYLALKKSKVPADLHLYSSGGHGYGLWEKRRPVGKWGEALAQWLKYNRFAE